MTTDKITSIAELRKAIEDEIENLEALQKLVDKDSSMYTIIANEIHTLRWVLSKIDSFEEALFSRKALAEKNLKEHLGECIAKYWDEGRIDELNEILGGKSG